MHTCMHAYIHTYIHALKLFLQFHKHTYKYIQIHTLKLGRQAHKYTACLIVYHTYIHTYTLVKVLVIPSMGSTIHKLSTFLYFKIAVLLASIPGEISSSPEIVKCAYVCVVYYVVVGIYIEC